MAALHLGPPSTGFTVNQAATVLGPGAWWLFPSRRLDGVSPLAILSPASGRSMLAGKAVNDNALISRQGGIKYVIGPDGSLQTVPANTLAYDYSNGVREMLFEGAATPGIRNSTGAGATQSGAVLPTYWGTYNGGGLTRYVTPAITEKGFPCLDIRMAGVLTESSWTLYFERTTAAGIAAVQGDTVTESLFLALVGGSFAGLEVRLELYERDSAGAGIIGSRSADIKGDVSGSPRRFSHTYTMVRQDCAYAHPRLVFLSSIGTAIDFTIRVALPQWEKAAVASSPVPTSGTLVTRPTDLAPLWAGAADATAWAWRGNVPSPVASVGLLDATGGAYIESGTTDPTLLRMVGAVTQIGDTGVVPGPVGIVIGWGPSGRRLQNAGKAVRADSTLVTFDRTAMRIGRAAGFSTGHIVRLRELVAWRLSERPSVDGVQSQAKVWSA
ncbi:hypothetical protein KL86PLE_110025 [uncultured Pleomorphomonas sp.]|uniref:Uncharacterized protein n=1 Tax=uncultured Pleomorphomonas sp. TaxID=442121 RepID=A0A212L7M8_9HYPH|nr:hypothetical protein [uncultured Pleomorphomonas sp.]SCM73329.1 hypothetical protein KL86PLE_110025 [uncultured Pleomorphomonas sp.]